MKFDGDAFGKPAAENRESRIENHQAKGGPPLKRCVWGGVLSVALQGPGYGWLRLNRGAMGGG